MGSSYTVYTDGEMNIFNEQHHFFVNAKNKHKEKSSLPWRQSDFCENCPIYVVDSKNSTLARIEFDLTHKLWVIEVLNGYKSNTEKGHINEPDRIKFIAEKLLKDTVNELQEKLRK